MNLLYYGKWAIGTSTIAEPRPETLKFAPVLALVPVQVFGVFKRNLINTSEVDGSNLFDRLSRRHLVVPNKYHRVVNWKFKPKVITVVSVCMVGGGRSLRLFTQPSLAPLVWAPHRGRRDFAVIEIIRCKLNYKSRRRDRVGRGRGGKWVL